MSGASTRVFGLLIAGHLLFVAGLAAVIQMDVERGNVWITPLFGIAWLLAGAADRWRKAAFVIVALTAVHYLAVEAAVESYEESTWLPGAVGGAIGAAGSIIVGIGLGLLRRDSRALMLAVVGTLLLALVGSFGVHMYLTSGGAETGAGLRQLLWIYTPWQVVFAFVLAALAKADAAR